MSGARMRLCVCARVHTRAHIHTNTPRTRAFWREKGGLGWGRGKRVISYVGHLYEVAVESAFLTTVPIGWPPLTAAVGHTSRRACSRAVWGSCSQPCRSLQACTVPPAASCRTFQSGSRVTDYTRDHDVTGVASVVRLVLAVMWRGHRPVLLVWRTPPQTSDTGARFVRTKTRQQTTTTGSRRCTCVCGCVCARERGRYLIVNFETQSKWWLFWRIQWLKKYTGHTDLLVSAP